MAHLKPSLHCNHTLTLHTGSAIVW